MNNGMKLDTAPRGSLPWPSDAVMIVAANAGEERRVKMEGVVDCKCRLCDRALRADTKTVRVADELPERGGRPIKFFCVECAIQHDNRQIEVFQDHR